jgi:hypothetical protein
MKLPNSSKTEFIGLWKKIAVAQFDNEHKNIKIYFVSDQHNENEIYINFIVIEQSKLIKNIEEFKEICEVNSSRVVFNEEFIEFINRLHSEDKINVRIFFDLKFKESPYFELNKEKLVFKKEIEIEDLCGAFENYEKQLDANITNLQNKVSELAGQFASAEEELNRDFPFSKFSKSEPDWKKFREEVEKRFAAVEKNKSRDPNSIFFRQDSKNSPSGLINEYSKSEKKEKFIEQLSNLDNETKQWFFFLEKEWSDESRDKFYKQFDKNSYIGQKKIKEDLETEKKNRENDLSKSIANKEITIKNLKSPQKATLNFYLEEFDLEPFLTTEVTIPFPSESAAIPSPTPVP